MGKGTAVKPRFRRFGQQLILLMLLLLMTGSAWGAEAVLNGAFSGSTNWTLTTATYDSTVGRAALGSAKVTAGRNTTVSGTAVQTISIPAGSTINTVSLYSQLTTTSEAAGDNVTVTLRYADSTTVTILSTGELTNSSWTQRTASPALVLSQPVNQVTVALNTRGGTLTGATANLWVDDLSIAYTPPQLGTVAGAMSFFGATENQISIQVAFTGDYDNDNTCVIEYGTTTAYGNIASAPVKGAGLYSATVGGLQPGRTYYFKATFTDPDDPSGVPGSPVTGSQATVAATSDPLLHNSINLGTKYWSANGWGIAGGQYGEITCATCHNRTTNNIKRVAGTIVAPNSPTNSFPGSSVTFKNVTAFGNDGGGHTASQRVCEVCHTQTAVHKYNQTTGDLNHKSANLTDCTSCHAHNKSFGASCNTCHGYPPINATLGTDGLASPATGILPANQAGAHDAHVNVRGMTCETCHQGYTQNPMGNQHIELGFNINGGTIGGFKGTFNGGSFASKTPYAPYSSNATYAGTTVGMATGNTNTCSSVYCHGGYAGSNGSMMAPSWTAGTAAGNCGTCHGTSQTTAPTSGNHVRHTGTAAGNMGIACSDCHGTLPTDNAHVNGNVVTKLNPASKLQASATYKGFANQSSAALNYGNCTVYCHSTVQNAAASAVATPTVSPRWGDPAFVSCDTSVCHGNPPSNGAHAKHQTYSYACDICHSTAGKDTSKHADYKIDVTFSGTASGGAYTQSAVNPPGNSYGNCSNLTCHGTGTTIGWNGSLADAIECDSCHGGNKSATATNGYGPIASGRHTSHIANANATLATFACGRCHAQTVTTGNDRLITGAAHVNGANNVNYDSLNSGKTYTGPTGCASNNTYCHSSGKGFAGQAVDWNVASSLGCNGCHGTGNAYGAPDNGTPNSHGNHAKAATDCFKCHAKTATAAGGALVAGTTDHLDGTIDARLAKVSSFTTYSGVYNANKTCSNTYCHGGTQTTAVAWGAGTALNCEACHKASNVASGLSANHQVHYNNVNAPTSYTTPTPGNLSTTVYQFACTSCHGSNTANHITKPIANGSDAYVFFGFSSLGKNPAYGQAVRTNPQATPDGQGFKWSAGTAGTCNNTYCHSNGQGGTGRLATLTWASAKTGACNVCHGDGTVTGSNDLSAVHYRHMGRASSGGSFGCADCHALTVNGNTSVSNIAKHVNKFNDYSGVMAGGSAKYSRQTKLCSNIYCHSNGKGTPANPTAWNAAYTDNGCSNCHGTSNTIGRPDNSTPNSHPVHATVAADCVKCHFKTVAPGGGAILAGSTDHLDRTIDARMKKITSFANYSGRYETNKTCSAVYCHGGTNGSTPAWGGTFAVSRCAACHESSKALSGAHMLHYSSATLPSKYANYSGNMSTATAYRFTCSSCHSEKKGAVHFNGPQQANGAADVFFGFTSATKKGAYNYGATANTDAKGFQWSVNGGNTAGNCNATYCHSDGKGTNGASAVSWSTTSRGANCNACHGNETNATSLSPAHDKHINNATYGGGFKCADCHAITITNTDNRTLANKAKHVNKFVDYSGLYAGRNKSCANFYCHSNGRGGFVNPPTWGSATVLDCSGCHGSTSGNLTSGNHAAHITAGAACQNCHWNTTQANGTIAAVAQHINKTVGVNQGSTFKSANVSFTGTTNCSNISCHSSGKFTAQPATWGGPSLGCDGCHPLANLSAPHATHMGTLTASDVIFYSYTGNHSLNAAEGTQVKYGLGCGNCHPVGTTAEATYHINGSVEVALDAASGGSSASALRKLNTGAAAYVSGPTGGCDLVYCHSDGKNTMVVNGNGHAPAWNTAFTAAERCAKCHGNSPQTAAHEAHQVGIHYNDIFKGTSGKLAAAASGASSHGVATQSTTITCNTCHYKTVTTSANDQNTLCKGCHTGIGHTQGDATIGSLAFHVNGTKEVSFKPSLKVISKAQLREASFPNYSGLWVRNGGITNYKSGTTAFDTAKLALTDSMWNSTGATCSNIACHNLRAGQTVTWTDATITCTSCHSKL